MNTIKSFDFLYNCDILVRCKFVLGDFMSKQAQKTNAERFIMAYNQIDYALRAIYGFKRSLSYADLIRKAVPLNSVVRKYEDELIDYGRLRNSIVHKTNPNYVIAEPHIEVVEDFEKIAKIISTPPLALGRVCKRTVLTCDSDISLKTLLGLMSSTGYKNIPVYEDGQLKGVAIGLNVLEVLGDRSLSGENLEDFVEKNTVTRVMSRLEDSKYFIVCDKNLTIESALNQFYLSRKLQLIIITETGHLNEKPLGVITVADILDMNAIIENY